MSTRLPWFKFNRGDYMRYTAGWPPLARLAYLELLFAQWDDGLLPASSDDLRLLVPGVKDADWLKIWPRLDKAFPEVDGGRMNPELDSLRAATVRTNKTRSVVAQNAANKRWGQRAAPDPEQKGKNDA